MRVKTFFITALVAIALAACNEYPVEPNTTPSGPADYSPNWTIQQPSPFKTTSFNRITGTPMPSPQVSPLAVGDCPAARVCLWMSTNFNGARWQVGSMAVNQCINITGTYDNNAESAKNNLSHGVTLFQFAGPFGGWGNATSFGPNSGANNLAGLAIGANQASTVCRP